MVFYDIRRHDSRKYARQHRIRMIPTQIFLDENGKEYYRHEGFFPKQEVEKVLARGGVDIGGK